MPVPTYGGARPTGLVPPPVDLSGVTELRVHGVGGTTPGALLDDLAPQQVAGDDVAGFFRTTDVRGRHVEAYSWGGLTSRSGTRVLWLLLLPFLLANLAGWMCSPAGRASALHRWLVRCGALAVTLNALLVIAMCSVDVLGYQCGTSSSCREGRWWLFFLRWGPVVDHPARAVLLGALWPGLILAVLALLSYRSRERYESVRPPGPGMPRDPRARSAASLPDGLADPTFWDGARATKRLGRAHVAAALGMLTVLVLHSTGLVLGPAYRGAGLSIALQVLALAAGAAAVWLLWVEEGPDWWGAALLLGALAVALAAAVLTWVQPAPATPPDGQLPGVREVINAGYGVILVVLALVLGTVLRHGRVRGSFGWAPFVVLAFAVALLNAVLLGLLLVVAQLVGPVAWTIGPGPAGTVSVWPVVQAAAPFLTVVPLGIAVGFALWQGWLVWRSGRDEAALAAVAADYADCAAPTDGDPVWHLSALSAPAGLPPAGLPPAGLPPAGLPPAGLPPAGLPPAGLPPAGLPPSVDQLEAWDRARAWRTRVARHRRLAVAGTDLAYLLTAIAVAGVLIMVVAQWWIWVRGGTPWVGSWLTALGTTLAAGLPVALVGALRSGWRSLDGRRRIGVLWDVGTFWPRSFHPLAPPSYAERAVPELQRRLWWVHDNGGSVLLAAHSQGTVLAAAALLQPSARAPGARIGLITFGSPLGKLYRWGFPAWIDDEVLRRIDVPWTNAHYPTDYIGGPVFSTPSPVDVRLADPRTCHYVYGQPTPPIGGHSGYWTDPAFWPLADHLADALATPSGPVPCPADLRQSCVDPAPGT